MTTKSVPNSSAVTDDPLARLFQVSGAATTRFGYDWLNMAAGNITLEPWFYEGCRSLG